MSHEPADTAHAQVTTAGAYVLLGGRFVFMVGPTPQADSLAVVRLGGHREVGETAWECAAREIREEASLHSQPVVPPATYWFQVGSEAETLRPGPPPSDALGAPSPLLAVRGAGAHADHLSVMYLASADGEAAPSMEARGLLLLSPVEVVRLVRARATLDEYRRAGGLAVLRDELPGHLPLEPLVQLRLLAVLLLRDPSLAGRPPGLTGRRS